MPVPLHNLHTWSGVFGSTVAPAEEWQFSLKYPVLASPATSATALDGTIASMSSMWTTHLRPLFRSHITLTRVQAAQVLETGKWNATSTGAFVRSEASVNLPGSSSSTVVYPYQVALAVSLTTARAGATGKGRFYLPAPAYQCDPDTGVLSSSNTATIAASVKAFIDALVPTLGTPRVFSSKGYSSQVTGIRVGRALDTQRRRRGDLPEGYAVLALA